MAKVVITIEDKENKVDISADFGDEEDMSSSAHILGKTLLHTVDAIRERVEELETQKGEDNDKG